MSCLLRALVEMHVGLKAKGDEDRIFALAELSFFHKENSKERSYYLAAAIYVYSFLFPGEHGTAPRGLDPRFRWVADADEGHELRTRRRRKTCRTG
jgi:hypothetical protein